ncbi:pentatricopeptide repeat-containing protein At2g37320-like [Gastrolobium bilobum]|uniref:pentatricopeptide repeat-containing protein At2g37320-like n=1 Tax=Gastrolobium bilobum TaxID=150636 RepID=UPI002AB05534|nr:pentatricopeptide repeat-containing protein At2g37320-like [Gastrolobium bilobum]XP_061338366.1 pentatricopeptide repeat-containing protein At2g37320-like [Gastrolobium bilobum]
MLTALFPPRIQAMNALLIRNPTSCLKNQIFRPFSSHKLVPRRANKGLTNALRVLNLVSPKKSGTDIENRRSHLRLIEDILENNATNPLGGNSATLRTTTEITIQSSVLQMEQGLGVDVCFLSHVVSSCGSNRDLWGGIQYHCLAITTGFTANVYVGSSLISLYSRCALLGDAYRVFGEMRERNVVSWTAIIAGFAQEWRVDICLELFHQMRGSTLKPNNFTYTSLLSACMGSGALGHGRGAHCQIIQMGFHSYLHIDNALIAMYSKCGVIDDALYIFENMVGRDVVTWNSMISGFAQHGLAREAINLFEEMIRQSVNPDAVTYLSVLSSCRHGGLVKEGQVYFNSMVEHGVQPGLDHYSCIVDLLGRAGLLLEARDFIQNIPVHPNAVIWGSLLSSSRLHGSVWIGIQAAESRLLLEPGCSATLQQLANLYASVGWWNQVARVRKLMKDKGLKPNPGCSWIEIKSKVHRFEAQDKSHSKMPDILLIMDNLIDHMSSLSLQSQMSEEC